MKEIFEITRKYSNDLGFLQLKIDFCANIQINFFPFECFGPELEFWHTANRVNYFFVSSLRV